MTVLELCQFMPAAALVKWQASQDPGFWISGKIFLSGNVACGKFRRTRISVSLAGQYKHSKDFPLYIGGLSRKTDKGGILKQKNHL